MIFCLSTGKKIQRKDDKSLSHPDDSPGNRVKPGTKIISFSENMILMESELLQKLANKSITKKELLEKVKHNSSLIPEIIEGVSSSKPGIRYGCAKVLMDLSEDHPQRLYPYMDFFTDLLDSKYRILTWSAIAIIANLTTIDKDNKFDAIFKKYYGLLNDEYMVTVANVVGHSGKIALAKPNLAQKIADELLKVENISTTPHLTEECRRVIAEKAIARALRTKCMGRFRAIFILASAFPTSVSQ